MKAKIILFYLLLTVNHSLSLYAQTWNTVGDKFYYNDTTPGGTVYGLKTIDSLLYVAGTFRYIGNLLVNITMKYLLVILLLSNGMVANGLL